MANFLDSLAKGYDLGSRLRRDLELRKIDEEPSDVGLDSVAARAAAAGPPDAMGPPDEQGGLDMIGSTATADPAAAQIARAQRRADVMRRFGDDVGADKLLANQAALEQTRAQIGEVRQRTANEATAGERAKVELGGLKRADETAADQERIRREIGGKINPLTATPADIIDNRRQLMVGLYAGGHTAAADKEAEGLRKAVDDQIKLDADSRRAAAKQLYSQVQAGDFSNVVAFTRRFGYGVGQSVSIQDIKPGPQPGTAVVVFNDLKGQGQQKVVPIAALQKEMLPRLQEAASDDPTVAKQAREKVEADIEQSRAAAAASRASAGHSTASAERQRAETGRINAVTEREKLLQDARDAAGLALDKPPEQRTPEEQQAVAKYEKLVSSERARGGSGARSPAERIFNGEVGYEKVTLHVRPDDTSEYLAPNPDAGKPGAPKFIWRSLDREQTARAIESGGGRSASGVVRPAGVDPKAQYSPSTKTWWLNGTKVWPK